jgi:hypothetical protein
MSSVACHDCRRTDAAAQVARAIAATHIDVYEAAVRTVTELQWLIGRVAILEPLSGLMRAWADATRDATAVQLSTARWILDL